MVHPGFPYSYWSLDRLCRQSGWKTLIPPLGLLTVAALLPRDWQIRLADENARPTPEADWTWADVVMVSGMLVQKEGLLALIRGARARGKRVVAGGPATSSLTDAMLAAGSDIVLRGEAEALVPALLEALASGRSGIVLEAAERPDLADSPVPRFDLVRMEDYGAMAVQTSRGCPHDCEFCDVVALLGRRPRHKTPDQVIAELEQLYRLGWRHEVFISDDNFIGSPPRARALLDRLIPWMKAHGEPFVFWTQASIRLGRDRDLIDRMTEANFSTVFVGIETLDDNALQQAGKHQNVRGSMEESVNAMGANGLNVVGSFVLGLDGESPDAERRIEEFVAATDLPQIVLNLLVPLPNTRLWQRLAREGRLLETGGTDQGNTTIGRLAYRPSRPAADVLAGYRGLWTRLMEPSDLLARAYRYHLRMRPTRAALRAAAGVKDADPRRPQARIRWRDVELFARLSWQLGVIAPCRWRYWAQLAGIRRRNPSRLRRYLGSLAMAEDLFVVRRVVLGKIDASLCELRGEA